MTAVQQSIAAPRTPFGFLTGFMALSLASGAAIGAGNMAVTLHAIKQGATTPQIGTILGIESLTMMLVTLPAGFLIARFGARLLYVVASFGPLLCYALMDRQADWWWLALMLGLVGLCTPFRIVSMNSAFLQNLDRLGRTRAGWYRAAQMTGFALVGPATGAWLHDHGGPAIAFGTVAAMFGAMALFGLCFFPDRPAVPSAPRIGVLAELRALLRHRDIAAACTIELIGSATVSLFSTFIVLLVVEGLKRPQSEAVLLIGLEGVVTIVALFLLGPLFLRIPPARGYAVSLVATIIALLLFGSAQTFPALAAAVVLLSGTASFLHFANMVQLGNSAGDKSPVAGLYNLASMMGAAAGSFGGAAMAGIAGLHSMFLLWIPVVLVAVAMQFVFGGGRQANG